MKRYNAQKLQANHYLEQAHKGAARAKWNREKPIKKQIKPNSASRHVRPILHRKSH